MEENSGEIIFNLQGTNNLCSKGTFYCKFNDYEPIELAKNCEHFSIQLSPIENSFIDFVDTKNNLKFSIFFKEEK